MGRMAPACAGILIVIAGLGAVFVSTAAASGVSCEEKVLRDWSDNGRVDGMYPLHCYQVALTTMPSDLRDYTNAGDAIQRALTRASTKTASKASDKSRRLAASSSVAVAGPPPTAVPLPLMVLGAVSTAVLAAGGLGWLARRHRSHQA
jgi:hypothetical protein